MIVQSIIKYGLGSRLTGASRTALGVVGKVSGVASGLYFGYSYGKTYGWGVYPAYIAASVWGPTGVALTILNGAKDLGNWAYSNQQAKTRSSFARNAVQDKFGTINKMRQASIQQLSRDHSSSGRVLGNEGLIFHR